MLEKFQRFWQALRYALKVTFVDKKNDSKIQRYDDISKINFLAVFVEKLANLTCTEATFEVESDSKQADKLKPVVEMLEDNCFEITRQILATGECYVFPVLTANGKMFLKTLSADFVKISEIKGDTITEAFAEIERVFENNKEYVLIRHHKLENNGDLVVNYISLDGNGKPVYKAEWADLTENQTVYFGANHIGFGRYENVSSSRSQSFLGVPFNFGCSQIEKDIFKTLEQIEVEFKNTETKIFADRSIAKKKSKFKNDVEKVEYDVPDNVFLVDRGAGETGSLIDIFNPAIRYSEYYQRLVNLFEQYEKQVGVSKGILSPNDSTATATATQVKRANADTLAFISRLRKAIDKGNRDTLQAFNLLFNVPTDLWKYNADWFDPFQDPNEQWTQIKDGVSLGVIKPERATMWLYPSMSLEDAEKEVADINALSAANADFALEQSLRN